MLLITAAIITALMTSVAFAGNEEQPGGDGLPSVTVTENADGGSAGNDGSGTPSAEPDTGSGSGADMESGGEPGTGGGTEPSQGGGTEPGPGGDSGQGGDPQLIEIAEAAVIEDIPAVVYNRKQHTPVPVVSGVSGDELVEGTDYTVSYGANVKAGTGTVTITGIGGFCGILTKEFTIEPKAITPVVTLSAKSFSWNNKVQKPEVTVKVGKTTLKASQYDLAWDKGCRNVGRYNVAVTLKGNYSGESDASFKIIPKGTYITGFKAASETFTGYWNKQAAKMSSARITGYQLQYSNTSAIRSGKIVSVKSYKRISRRFSKMKSGSTYYLRLRTYAVRDGKKYYSNWSKVKTVTTKAYRPRVLVYDNDQDNQRVVKMLENNGCRAEMLWSNVDASSYDALVIPGGHNIDPRMYGAQRAPETYGTNIEKDKAQIAMIKKFADAKKPVLGLCRGCQVINVAYGGTICQHIPGWHKWNRMVKISSSSWLYGAYGAKASVYHFHHQCVERVGNGLVATQWDASDGRVEAVEHKTLPVYGVQWHPDTMGDRGNAVFKKFRDVSVTQRERNFY